MKPGEARQNTAEDTLDILEQGSYINQQGKVISIQESQAIAVSNTYVYSSLEGDELLKHFQASPTEFNSKIEVSLEATLDTVRRLNREGKFNPLVLNFASPLDPGGGFLLGDDGQEVRITRSSGLYPCQLKAIKFYEANRKAKSYFYTDYMIYSPEVPIFKYEDGSYMDEYITASILTASAVNAKAIHQSEFQSRDKIEEIMRRRITKILGVAAKHRHEILVLGTCGGEKGENNSEEIASYFANTLFGQFSDQFREIIFAISPEEEKLLKSFQNWFSL